MAHFCKPPNAGSGYDVDNKLAPGSIWRVQVPLGGTRDVALWGGEGLWVKSNNPGVVPNDGFKEVRNGDLRILKLMGRSPGTSMLETGQGSLTWLSLQVQVVTAATSGSGVWFVKGEEGNFGSKLDGQGHLWRQEIYWGERAIVGLQGGKDLKIVSNNPRVVETGQEIWRGSVRIFPVIGVRVGDAMIEATSRSGAVLAHLQVHVNPKRPNYGAICSGEEAARRAVEILKISRTLPDPHPFPSQWGPVIAKPGQIWAPYNRLILFFDHQHVDYLQGDTLYSVQTADFAREIVLDGMVEGMNRARPMVTVTRVAMGFITGVLVGPAVIGAAQVIVLTMWAGAHGELVRKAASSAGPAFRGLQRLRERYPTLWEKIYNRIKGQLGDDFFEALKETVTDPENIAFYLGRVLRGCFFAPEDAAKIPVLSFGRIVFVVVECAALVTALHLPAGFVEVGVKTVTQLAENLKTSFAKPAAGITLSNEEANKIATELLKYSDTKQTLDELQGSLKDLQDMFEQLSKDLKDTKG